MSQLVNPIQGKLSKMRNSQMIRFHLQSQNTPLKIEQWTDNEKQNMSISHFPLHSKLMQKKQSESSVRKLTLLERKSTQKQISNTFYRNQLFRRKTKYEDQLMKQQQKYEKIINALEEQLISKMKKEQELDLQTEELNQLVQNITQIRHLESIQKLSDNTLKELEWKLGEMGIVGSQLLYSVQTINQNRKCSTVKLKQVSCKFNRNAKNNDDIKIQTQEKQNKKIERMERYLSKSSPLNQKYLKYSQDSNLDTNEEFQRYLKGQICPSQFKK